MTALKRGQRWQKARDARGLSLSDVEHELRNRLPRRWPSRTKVSRFERGDAVLELVVLVVIIK